MNVYSLRKAPEQIQIDGVEGQVMMAGTVDSNEARKRTKTLIRGSPGRNQRAHHLRVMQAGTNGATRRPEGRRSVG